MEGRSWKAEGNSLLARVILRELTYDGEDNVD